MTLLSTEQATARALFSISTRKVFVAVPRGDANEVLMDACARTLAGGQGGGRTPSRVRGIRGSDSEASDSESESDPELAEEAEAWEPEEVGEPQPSQHIGARPLPPAPPSGYDARLCLRGSCADDVDLRHFRTRRRRALMGECTSACHLSCDGEYGPGDHEAVRCASPNLFPHRWCDGCLAALFSCRRISFLMFQEIPIERRRNICFSPINVELKHCCAV